MLIKNKKGGEKYLSIWWFFIMGVIGVGVVAGVAVFNARNLDTRDLEADIIAIKIANCLVDSGYIKDNVFSSDFDFYKSCYFDKATIEDTQKYIAAYEVYPSEKCKLEDSEWKCSDAKVVFEKGVSGFKADCKISQGISAEEYPRCSEKYILTIDSGGKSFVLHIIAGTNNKGGRIAGV